MTVAIRSLNVPREHRLIAQGQTVNIISEIVDVGLTSVLLDPITTPTISVFNPVGTAVITAAEMTRLSLGIYRYNYQSALDDDIGLYTVSLLVVNGLDIAKLDKSVAFKVRIAIAFANFSYLGIYDQAGVLWYWYVNAADELTASLVLPAVPGRIAVNVTPVVIPYWVEINNANGDLRYVYPAVSGEITVSATVPAVGTGSVGSPAFDGVSGGVWSITLNVLDEIVLDS